MVIVLIDDLGFGATSAFGGPIPTPTLDALALDAPFGWMKQVAGDFGGTRNGLVVSWPKGIKARNEIRTQFSHVIDVAPTVLEAAGLPEPKVADLQAVFLQEVGKYHVLPMDDRTFERAIAANVGRPDLMAGRSSLTLAEGMTGMSENVFIDVKNKSKSITAEVEIPQGGGNGTIIAQGGRFGGWSLYVKDGVPGYGYNFLGMQRSSVVGASKLPPGKATIRFDFAYDGSGPGKGGMGTLFVDDRKVGEGRIEHTQAAIFSADETADVGIDLGTPVVEAIGSEAKSRFNGHIPRVMVEVKAPSAPAGAAPAATPRPE